MRNQSFIHLLTRILTMLFFASFILTTNATALPHREVLTTPSLQAAQDQESALTKKELEAKKKAKAKKKAAAKKKKVNPQISPSPKWPPKGFKSANGIFAKIPTKRELTGAISAKPALLDEIQACKDFACGSIFVASENACLWWEVLSTVSGPKLSDSATITSYGSLQTKKPGSTPRAQKIILLISPEPVAANVTVENINVICHRSGKKGKSGNFYLQFEDRQ
jgi:hypothetical protein